MMSGDADKRGHVRQSSGADRSGREPSKENSSSINWGRLREEVLRVFDSGRIRDWEWAIASVSPADVVQSVIADLIEAYDAGDEPRTYEELRELGVPLVRCKLASLRRRAQRHSARLGTYAAGLSTSDFFELICRRDEGRKFFWRVLELVEKAKDFRAKEILLLLQNGYPFHATLVLAETLKCDLAEVTRAKRRLLRKGEKAAKELNLNPRGDRT